MKRHHVLAGAAAMLAVPAAPAMADDAGWTGFHVGAQLGYSSGTADYDADGLMGYGDVKFNGFDGGVFAGYDHRFDRVVVGIGIDANLSDIDGDGTVASEDWCGALACGGMDTIDGNWEYEVHATYSLRLRAGFLATENLLLYGIGGGAMANTKWKNPSGVSNDTFDPDLGNSLDFEADHYGWLIGAGAEYAITELVHVKGEFIYYDYGTEEYASGGGDSHSLDLDMLTARIGASLNF